MTYLCLLLELVPSAGAVAFITYVATKLDDESLHIALALHLGAAIIVDHAYVCCRHTFMVTMACLIGIHSIGLLPHHDETICRALVSGVVLAILEPGGVCCEDPK